MKTEDSTGELWKDLRRSGHSNPFDWEVRCNRFFDETDEHTKDDREVRNRKLPEK